MLPRQSTEGISKLTSKLRSVSIERVSNPRSFNMWGSVLFVNRTSRIILSLQVYYSPYPFLIRSGSIFPWILSRTYPKLRAGTVFMLWLIGSRSLHAYLWSQPYLQQQKLLLCFSERYADYTDCHSIVSDRDTKFMSHFWQDIFRLSGVEHTMSTNYHS